jgi:cytochrome b
MAQLSGSPLTEDRVRAVLSFLSQNGHGTVGAEHAGLVADYLRMMEIHGTAASLREAVGHVPAGAAVNIARIAALRAQVSCGAHAERPVFAPDEEAAVRACSAEIDAALRELR